MKRVKAYTHLQPKAKDETDELLSHLPPAEIYESWAWCGVRSQARVYYRTMKRLRKEKIRGSKKYLKLMEDYYCISQSNRGTDHEIGLRRKGFNPIIPICSNTDKTD